MHGKLITRRLKNLIGFSILACIFSGSVFAAPPAASATKSQPAPFASKSPVPAPSPSAKPTPIASAPPAISAGPVETGFDAEVVRPKVTSPHLSLNGKYLPIFRTGSGSSFDYTVKLEWKVAAEHHIVLESKDRMETLPAIGSREFKLTKSVTLVTISTIGPRGDRAREELRISVPDWTDVQASATAPARKSYSLAAGLGLSSISYTQDGAAPLSEIALTPKVSFTRYSLFHSKWDGNITLFYSSPLTSSRAGVKLSYFGFNYRAGYNVPINPISPWTVVLSLGGYYTTTTATGDTIGFENQSGPQVLPSIRYRLSDSNSLGAYLKYAALISQFGFKIGGSELAFGTDFGHFLRSRKRLGVNLDFATLSAKDPTGINLTNQVISLGGSFGW